eukprot:7455451-Prorocentrum_lima.AAC.1
MTSSLVGSEMCIRDRLQPGGRSKVRVEDLVGRRLCSMFGFFDPLDEFISVSYTHLTLPTICSV